MVGAYASPENKVLFSQNEKMYDQYLSNFVESYSKNSNSMSYFNDLNEKLKMYTIECTKIFSQMKHMCYDLADLMLKTSAKINQISETYGTYVKLTEETYKNMKLQPAGEVSETDKKLQTGLSSWANQVIIQRQFTIDNFASFFHFKKHEYVTFDTLLEAKIKVDETFRKRYFELESKKQKLFEMKNVEKWKIQPQKVNSNLNDMFKNYGKARELMIPEVS